jgi:hypothetical protein|tara:strand:- start:58529 stop:59287 length:759 start_codon:yes stop_codon:yes gene_type:complete
MSIISGLLQNFSPIHLDEMDAVKLMNRVDTKYAFTRTTLKELLPLLTQHYKILEIDGIRLPTYKSLYFDDEKFTFYADHHKGKSSRFKVRIRNYVESGLYFLEVKHRWKGRVNKKRIRVSDFQHVLLDESHEFVNKNVTNLGNINPTMWNEYNRITLVNIERQERLTLDINLKFNWEEKHRDFDSLVIAELKQKRFDRKTPFNEIMRDMGIRPYRLSKYCIGTLELYDEKTVKHNFFKEKLIKLEKINEGII